MVHSSTCSYAYGVHVCRLYTKISFYLLVHVAAPLALVYIENENRVRQSLRPLTNLPPSREYTKL